MPWARRLLIEPKDDGKGRTFEATLLASVRCGLWESAGGGDYRPAWSMIGGTEDQLRPFMANVRTGRKVSMSDGASHSKSNTRSFELLKSAGYKITYQREPVGSIATAFLPSLFQLDPGMVDPAGASFVLLPTRAWAASQSIDVAPIVEHVRRIKTATGTHRLTDLEIVPLVATSFLFAAYLDRRTRCPLVSDGRFYAQLMLAALRDNLACFSGSDKYMSGFGRQAEFQFYEEGTTDVGMLPGVAFSAPHDEIEKLLAQEVTTFFKVTGES